MKLSGKIKTILILLITTVVTASFALPLSAAKPTYEMTEQYKSSYYYDNFEKVNLSGNQATDVLAVALSQLGYHEGDSDDDLGGLNQSGNKNFVEYNVLYGKLDNNEGNGYSYGYYWCAAFVNWCLREAGVANEQTAVGEVSCQRWLYALDAKNMYKVAHTDKGDYIPKSGDLIFFKSPSSTSASSHIGIVLYADEKTVYTIEGNTSNNSAFSSNGNYVCKKSYSLSDTLIVGYGIPKYKKNSNVLTVDYSGKNKTAGLYINERAIPVYKDTSNFSEKVTTIEVFHVFTVTEVKDNWFKISIDQDGNEYTGWIKSSRGLNQLTSTDTNRKIIYSASSEYVLNMPGEALFSSSSAATVSDAIPQLTDAKFLGWAVEKDSDKVVYKPSDIIKESGDITLYTVWDTEKHTIVFKYDNGEIISTIEGFKGDSITLPEVASERDGKKFQGWSQEVPGTIEGTAEFTAIYASQTDEISSENSEETNDKTNMSSDPSGCKSSGGGQLLIIFAVCMLAALSFKKIKLK